MTTMQMKIPGSFWQYGKKITVNIDEHLPGKEDGAVGIDRSYNCTMTVYDSEKCGRPRSETELTFCHELVHRILDGMEENKLRLDEQFVQRFANLLNQFMVTQEGDAFNG